jgi:Putative prokaryotic signal transducing protein
MRAISVHRDPAIIGFHQSILQSAGIPCYIRNENTSSSLGAGALGLVQSQLFNPVLCITDDDRYEEAVALIKQATEAQGESQADWQCSTCGETIPGTFELCWNCPHPSLEPTQG